MKGYIYLHRSPSGKCYIGQTYRNPIKRWANGKGYGVKQSVFHNAIQKYGWENFEHYILEEIDFDDIKELNRLEEYYILKYNSLWPNGYNLQTNGENSIKTDIVKKHMSDSAIGRTMSDEQKHATSDRLKQEWKDGKRSTGHLNTPDSIKKRVETFRKNGSNLGNKNGMYGKPGPMKGKHHSIETRCKLSSKRKNRVTKDSTRRKIQTTMSSLIWITNGVIDKRIHNDSPMPNGFYPGRTKFKMNKTYKDSKWYNNGIIQIRDFECPLGFVLGQLPDIGDKIRKNKSKYSFITKEIIDSIINDFKYIKDGLNTYTISMFGFKKRYKEIYGKDYTKHKSSI